MAYSKPEYISYKSDGVWRYILRDKVSMNIAKCNECGKVLKYNGGFTKGMHTHLKLIHGIDLLKRLADVNVSDASTSASPSAGKKYTQSMEKFLWRNDENTLQATISRMVECDGLPFRIFVMSHDV